MGLADRVAVPALQARRAVDHAQRGPARVVARPARGRGRDETDVAAAIDPTRPHELDRWIDDQRAHLGGRQRLEPAPRRFGLEDHRVGLDPVPATGEGRLVAVVAQAPGDEAGPVAADARSGGAFGPRRSWIAPSRALQEAAAADERTGAPEGRGFG